MLVITRHRVALNDQDAFLVDAKRALALLAERDGCRGVTIGRAADDAELLVLTSEWNDVGSYRHALSAYDVKVGAVPLLSTAIDEPTAFEVLHRNDADGVRDAESVLEVGEWSLGRPGSAS